MNGLSKITDKIIFDARQEADQRLRLADEKCEKIRKEYREKAELESAAIAESARAEAAQIAAAAKAEAGALEKNTLLTLKGDMLDRAFDTALEDMAALKGEERLSMLVRILTAAVRNEYEAEKERAESYSTDLCDEGGEMIYEILLNKKDAEKHGNQLIESFKRSIVGKDFGDIPSRLRLSGETASIQGGLILRRGAVELNCSVEKLIASCRASLEAGVLDILFTAKKQ